MAVVTELVTKFSFQGSTAPLADFNKDLGVSVGLIGAGIAGLVALSGAISAFVITTLSGADAVGQLAINSGVAVETIQELGFAASVSGSSTAALEGTIDSLSQTIGQAAQKGNEDFARLGISVRDVNGEVKTADTILGEVGQRFKDLNLSMQEQQSFAQALGIDSSLLQLLNKSSEEMLLLRKRARDLGVVTKKQQASIIAFNDSFTTLRFGMDAISKQISIGLSPSIKEMADRFTDFLAANKDLIADGFQSFAEGVGVILDALIRLRWVLAAVGVALAIVAAIMSPITFTVLAITAGIVLLLAIIDDLIVAFSGGESVIRDFFLAFFGFDITTLMQNYVKSFKLGIEGIKMLFIDLFSFVNKGFDKISNVASTVSNFLGIGPEPSPGAGATNNSVSQAVTIEIKTDDPLAAGAAVNDALQGQLENANTQLVRGGR